MAEAHLDRLPEYVNVFGQEPGEEVPSSEMFNEVVMRPEDDHVPDWLCYGTNLGFAVIHHGRIEGCPRDEWEREILELVTGMNIMAADSRESSNVHASDPVWVSDLRRPSFSYEIQAVTLDSKIGPLKADQFLSALGIIEERASLLRWDGISEAMARYKSQITGKMNRAGIETMKPNAPTRSGECHP